MVNYNDFDLMHKDRVIAKVVLDYNKQKAEVLSYDTNPNFNPLHMLTGTTSINKILYFFESRCFPRYRANASELLESLDLEHYSPSQIVRKTHGIEFDDYNWIRFDGEDLTYEDVKVRD